jgi:single-stranded-DNA-specific exonuclease
MPRRNQKRWRVPKRLPDVVSEELHVFPTTFRQILYNRGIVDSGSAGRFLGAENPVHDPFLLRDMPKAVERVLTAVKEYEKILVFGDYDVDGVTATVLLFEFLTKVGARVMKYIPNRFDEGYGFSPDALQSVLELKPDLVITVDSGVRSTQEIADANRAGIDVIITDHHQPHEILPEAHAIICPRQPEDEYPFKSLAGVGLAYKLAEAISREIGLNLMVGNRWLDLVALGTVADLAPLVDENRTLVRRGLEKIQSGNRPGLMALANVSGVKIQRITSENIGFMLGPRLNAAGRLGSAYIAFQLLTSTDPEECGRLTLLLDRENSRRQDLTKEIQTMVESQIVDIDQQWVLFNYNAEYNEGVIGLAASKLTESFYRPAIIGSLEGEFIRASCRSIPEVNITSILDQVADLLVQHGGHAMAAGLKLEEKNKDEFVERVSDLIAKEVDGLELVGFTEVDAEVELPELKTDLLDLFRMLEPTGLGNPAPLFVARGVEILYPKAVGRERDHLKLAVRNPRKNGQPPVLFDAIAFNYGYLEEEMNKNTRADILFSYEWNEYNGNKRPQLNIRDLRLV